MVQLEELDDSVEDSMMHKAMDAAKAHEARPSEEAKADGAVKKGFFGGDTGQKKQREKGAAIKKGFLNSATETLYGPEGSPEGEVSDEVKMNRMETSTHSSDLAKDMVRKTERWQKALAGEEKEVRLAFSSLADEDVETLLKALGKNERVEAMDLSHNNIQDAGIQTIVTFLATTDNLPHLRELRLYHNNFGALGTTMVMQGLTVFRPQLRVLVEPPEFMLKGKS